MKRLKQTLAILSSIPLLFGCGASSTKSQSADVKAASVDAKSAKGKIAGVVTYYFNDNLQYVADVGAKVFITRSSDVSKEIYDNPGALMQFCSMTDTRDTWMDYINSKEKPEASLMQRVHEQQLDDTAHFNSLDRQHCRQFAQIENASKINRVADGNGSFSAEVDTGEYFVLIKSAHRKANTLCSVGGKTLFKWVILKPDQEENISPRFSEMNDPFYGL